MSQQGESTTDGYSRSTVHSLIADKVYNKLNLKKYGPFNITRMKPNEEAEA
jgi:hypothetical protein